MPLGVSRERPHEDSDDDSDGDSEDGGAPLTLFRRGRIEDMGVEGVDFFY